jgi:transaldolase
MVHLSRLGVKIFADGADFDGILKMYANPLIKGFATNPSLMRKAGIGDYEGFAGCLLDVVPDRPISFEVFADEPDQMARQAQAIASWGGNLNVKMNTRRELTGRSPANGPRLA